MRLLIVSAARGARGLLAMTLAVDAGLEVQVAASAAAALESGARIAELVVLDLDTEAVAGMKSLLRAWPRTPLVVVSRSLVWGAPQALEAVAVGAAAFVSLRSESDSGEDLAETVRSCLLPRIRELAVRPGPAGSAARPPRRPGSSLELLGGSPVQIVAVGASTGGPEALTALLPAFPADWPVPTVIVQHMPPVFTRMLCERLSSRCSLPVREAIDGEALRRGEVWLAPGDHHLEVVRDGEQRRQRLHQGAPQNSCRPSVDVLFGSVAATYGRQTLAVLLTGMGRDGLLGCQRIREAGGQVLVQDEASSVVWGMPGCVARAGLADAVLPLEQLAPEVLRRTRLGRSPLSSLRGPAVAAVRKGEDLQR